MGALMEELCYMSGAAILREPYVYRGEGNAHLALALPATKRILRIKKQNPEAPDSAEDWRRDVRFYKDIMVPLFAPFADDVHPVHISPEETSRLETNLQNLRPDFRRHKRLRCDNAALFNDYAYLPPHLDVFGSGPTFSVEIKPKQGFPIDGTCMFCEKQRRRFSAGKVSRTSEYCPLLLFSRDEKKIGDAIRGLVETPQNNLQVFRNGELCYGQNFQQEDFNDTVMEMLGRCMEESNCTLLSSFCYVINTILTQKFAVNNPCTNCETLEKHSVLDCLYSVQAFDRLRRIYNIDCEKYAYANKYLEDASDEANRCPRCVMRGYVEEREESFCRNRAEYLYGLIDDVIEKNEYFDWDGEDEEVFKDDCRLLREETYAVSVPHYVSKIARDCSFMITLRKATDMNEEELKQYDQNMIKTEHGSFIFTIKVFDLYPKIQKRLQNIL